MESDPPAEASLVCAECGRQPREHENAEDEWRAYLDINDGLPVFCPQCAAREFGG
jgi:DNA-directed RNA polymerase subunit RPC12/RpoP